MNGNGINDKPHFPVDPDAPKTDSENQSFLKYYYFRKKKNTDNIVSLLLILSTVLLIFFSLYITIVKYIL